MVISDENWELQESEPIDTKTETHEHPSSYTADDGVLPIIYDSTWQYNTTDDEIEHELDLSDLDEIYQSEDFDRLHPHLKNGSLVVLPKAQLMLLMAHMRDNMILLNGLDTLAEAIKPVIEQSVEGQAMVDFLLKNAKLFSGEEIGAVDMMRLAGGLPSLFKHVKALMAKINMDIFKNNEDFYTDFVAVLQRNNSPFLKTIGTFTNGVKQLKE